MLNTFSNDPRPVNLDRLPNLYSLALNNCIVFNLLAGYRIISTDELQDVSKSSFTQKLLRISKYDHSFNGRNLLTRFFKSVTCRGMFLLPLTINYSLPRIREILDSIQQSHSCKVVGLLGTFYFLSNGEYAELDEFVNEFFLFVPDLLEYRSLFIPSTFSVQMNVNMFLLVNTEFNKIT